MKPPRPWLAALLSLLQTGLGHFYVGMPGAAVAFWLGYHAVGAILVVVLVRVGGAAPLLAILLAGIVMTIGVAVHASRVARWSRGRQRLHGSALVFALAGLLAGGTLIDLWVRRWVHRNVVEAFRIPSGAMEPTLMSGDWIFVVPRRERTPREDEIVVFHGEGTPLIKRIAGVAGDTLEMRQGRLVRNGRVLAEPYTFQDPFPESTDSSFAWQSRFLADRTKRRDYQPRRGTWGPLVVPAGRVFMLGDNRGFSLDSRYLGFVEQDSIFGRPKEVYFSWSIDSGTVRWNRIGLPLPSTPSP